MAQPIIRYGISVEAGVSIIHIRFRDCRYGVEFWGHNEKSIASVHDQSPPQEVCTMEASLPVTMKYIYFICRFSPAPRNGGPHVDWKLKARARSAIHSEITSYNEKTQNTNHIAWTRMILTRDRPHQQTRSPVGGRIAIRLAWFSERKPTQLNLECHLGTRNHL